MLEHCNKLLSWRYYPDNHDNEYVLSLFNPDRLNVLTIHAEVEGMACFAMFERFLKTARSRGVSFVPLGSFLMEPAPTVHASVIKRPIHGREGWVSYQAAGESGTD